MSQNDMSPAPKFVSPLSEELIADVARLERQAWRNWTLVVGVILLACVGMAWGLYPELREHVAEVWPWAGTDEALTAGLAITLLLSTAYLTAQQRSVISLRRKLSDATAAAHAGMQQHVERLYGLLTVSRSLATATDPRVVFDCITRTCLDVFEGEQVSLMLIDRAQGDLEVLSATGHENAAAVVGKRTPVGQGIAGWVAENRRPLLLGPNIDADQYEGFEPKSVSLAAAIVVPIIMRDELLGVLNVARRTEGVEYNEEDVQALMVFGENAGIAVRHAEQSSWMRDTIRRLDAALQEQDGEDGRKAA